jgi:hypothetical protein
LDEKINTEQPEGFTEGRIKFGSWKKVFMDWRNQQGAGINGWMNFW